MTPIARAVTEARQIHRAGDVGQAEHLYRQILETDPENAEVLNLLGMACHQLNRLEDAMACYRQALLLQPENADIFYNLGLAFQTLGRLDEAAVQFRQALQFRPDLAAGHYALGNTLLRQRKLDEAADQYRQTILLHPKFGPAYLNMADALQSLGKPAAAADCLRQCLRLLPQFPDAHYNLGNVLQSLDRLEEAATHYEEALRLRPNFAEAHNNLGTVLLTLEKVDEAAEHFTRALNLQPNYVEALYGMGNACKERKQVAESIRLYERALQLRPDFGQAHHGLAEAYLEQGDMKKAGTHFRKALPNNPFVARTLLNMAAHGLYTSAEPSIDRLNAWLTEPHLAVGFASELHFTLGYLLDRAGTWDEAFDHFRQGNALRRSLFQQSGTAFDSQELSRQIDRLIAAFTPEYFRQVRGWGLDSELPVFIVGMPRSGSTLVEQILSAHPRVFGAGELKDMSRIAADVAARFGSATGGAVRTAHLDSAEVRETAETYLRTSDPARWICRASHRQDAGQFSSPRAHRDVVPPSARHPLPP